MQRFIRCVGRAVAVKGVRGLRGDIPFDEVLFDVAAEVRRLLNEDELRTELQNICQKAAADRIRRVAPRVVWGVAPDLPAEVQQALASYLSFTPSAVRQALKRPDDSTGTTVPAKLPLSRPEHLMVLLPAGPARFRPGERPEALDGWKLMDLLGVGGFGEVWLAENVRFPAIRAAVKFCLNDATRERLLQPAEQLVRRVLQVQAQLPKLAHGDGIVPLQNADLTADPPWLRYQHIEGHNLSGLVLNWANLKGPERGKGATAVMRRLARIVGQFHRLPEPITHGDLKPTNVLVCRGPDGKMLLRVSDYGISQMAARRAIERSSLLTPRGSLAQALRGAHTPLYASPQQKLMRDPDVRDDVFALGVMWYQLLLGDLTLERPAGPWRERVTYLGMNAALLDLLEECVADDAARRPFDAAELAERLAGKPPSPPPAPPPPAPPPPVVLEVKGAAEPVERFSDEPLTETPAPSLADLPSPATLPVDGAVGPAERLAGENAAPSAAAISVDSAAELTEPLSEESPAPPAAVEVDETEVVAELLRDEPVAPPLATPASLPPLPVGDAAERAEPLGNEPPSLPSVSPPALAIPAEDGADLAEVMTDEPPAPPIVAVDETEMVAAVLAAEPSEAPPAAVAVDEAEVVAELLKDEPPAPPPAAPLLLTALPRGEAADVVELLADEATAPPMAGPPPSLLEDGAAEMAEPLWNEPPSPPPAPPATVIPAEDGADLAEVMTDEFPAPPPSAPPVVAVDEAEVAAELLKDEPSEAPPAAPLLPTALPRDEVAEVAELSTDEPSAPPLAVPPPPTPFPTDNAAETAEPLWDEPPIPPPVPPPAPAIPVDDGKDLTEVMTDEFPEPPPAAPPAIAVDEAEVSAELLKDEPSEAPPAAPLLPPALPRNDVAEVVQPLADEPPAPPLAVPPPSPRLPEDDAAEMAKRLWDEPPSPPPIITVDDRADLVEVLADEPPAPPPAPPPVVEVDETEVVAELSADESPAPPPAVPPLPIFLPRDDVAKMAELVADESPAPPLAVPPPPIPENGAAEMAERLWDEPPPTTPPAVEDDVAEVLAEWLIDEPPEPPAAPPLPVALAIDELAGPGEVLADEPPLEPPAVTVDEAEVLAELFKNMAPAPPPAVPPPPAARPVPTPPTRERFLELSIPLPEGPREALPMRFAWIPPGEFLMGDGKYDEEKPVRRVTIRKGFYMGVFSVTQAQWRCVMNYNASLNRGDEQPVEMVSWTECQEFCRQLQQLTGKSIRLPTEAEWEYACRSGTTGEYYTGDGEDALRQAGWYQGNSGWHTHPVGKLAASAWGLYDMHGNVWEWCQDWHGPYAAADETDPQGPDSGELRVLRGGSWRDPPGGCRASARGQIEPDKRFFEIGCRVCFSPE